MDPQPPPWSPPRAKRPSSRAPEIEESPSKKRAGARPAERERSRGRQRARSLDDIEMGVADDSENYQVDHVKVDGPFLAMKPPLAPSHTEFPRGRRLFAQMHAGSLPRRRSESAHSRLSIPESTGRMTPMVELFPGIEGGYFDAHEEPASPEAEPLLAVHAKSKSLAATLPIELLQKIFSHLTPTPANPSTHDLSQCTRICAEWYFAAVQLLWRAPKWRDLASFDKWIRYCSTITPDGVVTRSSSFISVAPAPGHLGPALLRHLDFSTTPYLTSYLDDSMLQKLEGLFPGVTHVDLGGCGKVSDVVGFISRTPSHITSLNVSSIPQLTDTSILIISHFLAPWARIKHLSLRNCGKLSDATLTALMPLLATLRSLDVSGCKRMSDHGLSTFVKRMSGRLEKFGMAGCWRVSRTGYLGLLPTLFASNHRLTSFESSLPLHPSASADQVFTELPVRLFKNLTSLALRDVERSLNDPIFMKLVEACGNLKKLTIVGAVQLTEPTFIKGIAKMELEVLGMPGAKRLGDEALLSLVKSASNQTLVELDVSSWLISDHGLFRALENGSHPFPNLSTLKMVDIVESSFSFHGIFAVARACQGLEVLDVSGCTDLNDEEAGHAALAGPPGQGDEVVELGVGAGVAAEIDENGQGGEQLAQAEPVGTGLPGADRVSLPTPTPVTDAFVQSLLSVPEHPIGAAKISGSLRWYCLLKGDKLRRVVDEGVRRRGGLVGVAAG